MGGVNVVGTVRDMIGNSGIRRVFSTSHSQNASGDLRGVAGGDGKLGCLCGKAGTSHLCVMAPPHSSGCVVNGYNAMTAF